MLKCNLIILSDKNPFDLLKNLGISHNSTLRGTAGSAYKFFMVVGIIGLVSTFMISGISFSLTKNSSKKSNIKEAIGFKTWVAIGLFGFITLMGLVYNVIVSLV